MGTFKLLIIEDEHDLRRGLAGYFSDLGYTVSQAENGKIGLDLFRETQPDLVFTDLRMPVMDGFAVIEGISQESPSTPIIVISGTGVITDAIRAMKLGACDYVVKPVQEFEELVLVVKRALNEKTLHKVVASLKTSLLDVETRIHPAFSPITTSDPALLAILKYLEAVAGTSEPILVQGETGTGKELIARAIHQASSSNGAFVAVNIAGLDDQLFSDTLFGHVRGAFTGAEKTREGLVAQARGGTLFLDEIGDLTTASQVKLLRLLQDGEYYPIGSDLPRSSNARILVATHCNLPQLVKAKAFRHDLYYRLNVHQVTLPPLRKRTADLPLLIERFVEESATKLGKNRPAVPRELAGYLATYEFPGNIRELQGMVFDAVARHTKGMLSMNSFLDAIGIECHEPEREARTAMPSDATIVLHDATGERTPTLKEAEELLVAQALKLSDGNQGAAAARLGITRAALNKKLIRKSLKNNRNHQTVATFVSPNMPT